MNTEKISATLTTIAASHVGAPPSDNQQAKKAGAALLAHIGVYAEEAEKVTSHSKGNGLGAEAPPAPATPPSTPSDSDAGQSDSSDDSQPALPPLLALIMAGITIESQTNGLMTSLGTMSSAMTKASTDAAANLAANLKAFYDHGNAGGGINAPTPNLGLQVKIDSNNHWQIELDGTDTWIDGGLAMDSNNTFHAPTNLPPGCSFTNGQKLTPHDLMDLAEGCMQHQGQHGKGDTLYVYYDGGGGVAADLANPKGQTGVLQRYQQMQNDANTTNTQFGTLCALGGTGQQELTQAVNTAEGDQSSTIQVVSSLASMVNGWAGV